MQDFIINQESVLQDATLYKHQYLAFTLNKEVYALRIAYVKEIIEYTTLTPVPMVPIFIRGVLNLRGNVLPVIDLAVRLGGPVTPVSKWSCIVIIALGPPEDQVKMGVLVDTVNDVLRFKEGDLEPPPPFGSHLRNDFIQNIGKLGDRFITLLNVEQVLAIKELMVQAN